LSSLTSAYSIISVCCSRSNRDHKQGKPSPESSLVYLGTGKVTTGTVRFWTFYTALSNCASLKYSLRSSLSYKQLREISHCVCFNLRLTISTARKVFRFHAIEQVTGGMAIAIKTRCLSLLQSVTTVSAKLIFLSRPELKIKATQTIFLDCHLE
jgi:hypothetical protein